MYRMNWVHPTSYPSIMTFRSVTSDRGRTWSPPQQVLGQVAWPWLHRLPDGGIMLLGSGASGTRYLVSYDEASTWDYEGELDPCGDAITSTVTLDDRTIFTVHGAGLGSPQQTAHWYQGLRGRWIRKV